MKPISPFQVLLASLAIGVFLGACVDFNSYYASYCTESGRCETPPPPVVVTCSELEGPCSANPDCCDDGSCVQNVCKPIGELNGIELTPRQLAVPADFCSGPIVVRLVDEKGRTVPVLEPIDIAFLRPQGFEVFLADGCSEPIAFHHIEEGSAEFEIWIRPSVLGPETVPISAEQGNGRLQKTSSLNVTVSAGLPASLQWLNEPHSGRAGSCVGPLMLGTRDAKGRPTVTRDALPVVVTSNSDAGSFFSTESCTSPANLGFPSDAGALSLFYRDLRVGSPVVSVTAASLDAGLAQPQQIVAAEPASVRVTTGPVSVINGECSTEIAAELRDEYENRASFASEHVAAFSGASLLELHSTAGCDSPLLGVPFPAGSDQASFFVEGLTVGSAPFTLVLSPDGGTDLEWSQMATVLAADSRKLEFEFAAPGASAGGCSQFLVRLVRATGVVPLEDDLTVTFSSSQASDLKISTTNDCSGAHSPTVVINQGLTDSAPLYLRTTIAGTRQLAATPDLSTLVLGGTHALVTNPGPPVALRFEKLASSVAAGTCVNGSLTVRDDYGNVTPAAADLLMNLKATAVGKPTPAPQFHEGIDCSNSVSTILFKPADGSRELSVMGTLAADWVLSASDDRGTLVESRQDLKIIPGPADHLLFQPPTRQVGQEDCVRVGVSLADKYENLVNASGRTEVELSTDGMLGFSTESDCATSRAPLEVPIQETTSTSYFKVKTKSRETAELKATFGSLSPGVLAPFSVDPCMGIGASCPGAGSCCDLALCTGTPIPKCCYPTARACTDHFECCSRVCEATGFCK